MFDALSDRFEGIFKRLRGKGRLTRGRRRRGAARDPRRAARGRRQPHGRPQLRRRGSASSAVGADLAKALNPAQQVIKIVNEELITRPRRRDAEDHLRVEATDRRAAWRACRARARRPNSAKLARWFKAQGRNPLLVGADLQRPAAVEQLRTLGRQIDVPVFSEPTDPVAVAARRRRGGAPARPRRRHRRHRRSPGDRRRDDGAGPQASAARRARLHVPRHRRHDRSGRGEHSPRRSTRRSRSTA